MLVFSLLGGWFYRRRRNRVSYAGVGENKRVPCDSGSSRGFFGIDLVSTVHRFVECSEYSNVYCNRVGILTGLTAVILRPLPAVWTLFFCVSGDGRVMTRYYQRTSLPSPDSRKKTSVKAARLLSSRHVNIGFA